MPLNRDKAVSRGAGKAIHRYGMISDGDRIAVALSGGKDSLTLMWALQERLSRVPIHYSLLAIYVDLGFDGDPADLIEDYCRKMGYAFQVEHTDYGRIAHSEENRENPCFLCSRLRRKRLFELTRELGCNKLAFGHHMDDIIETLFLNMCYSGELSTMVPHQPFFNGELTIIRPLVFLDESTINRFAKRHAFPQVENPCPTARTSRRHEIRKMLEGLYRTNKKIKGNIFRSMSRVKPDYLLQPKNGQWTLLPQLSVNKMKLNHVALVCSSEQRADKFYQDVLGFEKVRSFDLPGDLARRIFEVDGECRVLVYGNRLFTIEVFLAMPTHGREPGFEHVCVEVEDIGALITRCETMRVEVNRVPKGDRLLNFVRDYDGNLFEIKEVSL